MKRLPNNIVHKALLAFLKKEIGCRVYDFVPEDAVLPFVTLGTINAEDKSTKSEDIIHMTVQIHIWSTYRGRYEINSLAEKIIRALSAVQLDLSEEEFYSNAQGVDFYESYPEENSGYNGVITFEMLIQNMRSGT
uniref:DUF3168 domain-containing protein n=1 Tax=Siphoviridae sp. ctr0c13 TaxID=2825683 RepID=A0A8S5TV01_9CAUD|nr:MAG TPA: hypothetical protein [Siphoviridae sp. ctr0c13]